MFADGVLGNRGLLNLQGAFMNGIFNYIRPPNTSPYSLKSILGNIYAYLYTDIEVDPSESLKVFLTQAQGFSMSRFER